MFNKVNPFPRINAYNFAINSRCYDVQKMGPMYPTTLAKYNNNTQTAKPGSKGFDIVKTNQNYD
jgi:hypothetical protein